MANVNGTLFKPLPMWVIQGGLQGTLVWLHHIGNVSRINSHVFHFLIAEGIKILCIFSPWSQHCHKQYKKWCTFLLFTVPNSDNEIHSPQKQHARAKMWQPFRNIRSWPRNHAMKNVGLNYYSAFSLSEDILIQVAMGSRPIGLVKRTFRNLEIKLLIFPTHVRLILDYCPIVWSS